MPVMRYGAQFRKHRRLSQALLNPNASRGYARLHEELANRLIAALTAHPEQFNDHTLMRVARYISLSTPTDSLRAHSYAASTIFKLTYDVDVTSEDHHLIRLGEWQTRAIVTF